MSDNISDSICIVPGGKNIVDEIKSNSEINLYYKDYNISIVYSPDFIDDIKKGFLVTIDYNFDIYKSYISYDDIKKSNNNIKFIKTIEINPDLIINNINSKNITINNKSNYLDFIVNIVEFNNNINLVIKQDNTVDDKDTKIKKLEKRVFELENSISNNKLNKLVFHNFYEIFESFFPFTQNSEYNNYMKDFIYNNKFKELFKDIFKNVNLIENNSIIKKISDLHLLNHIIPISCDKFTINKFNDFEFINCSKNDQSAFSSFSNFKSNTITGFNININFLLSKNILLKKVIFNQNPNYSKIFNNSGYLNYSRTQNYKYKINNIIKYKLIQSSSNFNKLLELFHFEDDTPFEYTFEYEILNNNHNIKQVMFEVINPDDDNNKNKKYISKCNLFDVIEYGIYIIQN